MPPQFSRRAFLKKSAGTAGSAALAGALASCATKPPVPGTMSKAEAHYQDKPHGLSRCSFCHHFYSPDICEVVAGPVSRDGWCEHYALL